MNRGAIFFFFTAAGLFEDTSVFPGYLSCAARRRVCYVQNKIVINTPQVFHPLRVTT